MPAVLTLSEYQITNCPYHSGAPVGAAPPTRSQQAGSIGILNSKPKPQTWLPHGSHPKPTLNPCVTQVGVLAAASVALQMFLHLPSSNPACMCSSAVTHSSCRATATSDNCLTHPAQVLLQTDCSLELLHIRGPALYGLVQCSAYNPLSGLQWAEPETLILLIF
jgi:hypothetical protein